MSDKLSRPELMTLTAQIVSSYVSGNAVPAAQLPGLIQAVARSLTGLGSDAEPAREPEQLQPAVPIRKSVQPDYLVCLEDGKKLKMLKRHLKTVYNMTPDEYRQKWGLPSDYPMVAPNYAESRSRLAKEIGLGRRSKVE